MDQRLLTWARQVKQRQSNPYPTLWLFTDATVLPNPLSLIATLPAGLCGVVYRHDTAPDRLALGRAIAKLCRQRRIALVVAGDARLAAALHAGLHLRAGRWPDHTRPHHALLTASAHNPAEITRAKRAGAKLIFISPVFPTASHPGAKPLGNILWLRLACFVQPAKAYALGGISGHKMKTLANSCCGAASIRAISH
jgi:thiamine-phosphate pyrophosphorylase